MHLAAEEAAARKRGAVSSSRSPTRIRSGGASAASCIRSELLDAACVERLVASEWQQQLRHAMGEGTKHCSQPTVADHRGAAGHKAIVVGEA
jgi:hypothetical protein